MRVLSFCSSSSSSNSGEWAELLESGEGEEKKLNAFLGWGVGRGVYQPLLLMGQICIPYFFQKLECLRKKREKLTLT